MAVSPPASKMLTQVLRGEGLLTNNREIQVERHFPKEIPRGVEAVIAVNQYAEEPPEAAIEISYYLCNVAVFAQTMERAFKTMQEIHKALAFKTDIDVPDEEDDSETAGRILAIEVQREVGVLARGESVDSGTEAFFASYRLTYQHCDRFYNRIP